MSLRFSLLTLVSLGFLSLSAIAREDALTIYYTNDVHGYVQEEGAVDLAKIAALHKDSPESLLVDAGDFLQGAPLASITRGRSVVELMNRAGYDVVTLGNHEFDYGQATLKERLAEAEFAVVAANILENGQYFTGLGHAVYEVGGIKVGFFGLTTTYTPEATAPANIAGLTFENEIECAKREIAALENAGAELIVGLCHLGEQGVPCTSAELAAALTGDYQGRLDVILDGHNHRLENDVVNGVLIAQTGTALTHVGRLTVSREGNSFKLSNTLLGAADVEEVIPDSEVSSQIATEKSALQDVMNVPLTSSPVPLWGGWVGNLAPARYAETNLGDLICDVLRHEAVTALRREGIDPSRIVAVANGGGMRDSLPRGTLTAGDLLSVLPFANQLIIKKLSPADLYALFEISARVFKGVDENGVLDFNDETGAFLQVSGLKVILDPDATGRVREIRLADTGELLAREDRERSLYVVANSYIMGGGNDYTLLGTLPEHLAIGFEYEAVRAYLASHPLGITGYFKEDGRIRYRSQQYEGGNYTARLRFECESGVHGLQSAVLLIDGRTVRTVRSDPEGFVTLTLSEGSHSVSVQGMEQAVLISNYLGIGLVEDRYREIPVLRVNHVHP